jgi:hypothetical protein
MCDSVYTCMYVYVVCNSDSIPSVSHRGLSTHLSLKQDIVAISATNSGLSVNAAICG